MKTAAKPLNTDLMQESYRNLLIQLKGNLEMGKYKQVWERVDAEVGDFCLYNRLSTFSMFALKFWRGSFCRLCKYVGERDDGYFKF